MIGIPIWATYVFVLVSFFNFFMFLSLVVMLWRPDYVPVAITGDVALGMHLQLFESFLASLGIGLAVFGFVGYQAIRELAERKADQAVREALDLDRRMRGNGSDTIEPAELGTVPSRGETTSQEETSI